MADLELIDNPLTSRERIQHRIDALYRDIAGGEISDEHVVDILEACYEYMQYSPTPKAYMVCIKLNEAMYYLEDATDIW